MMGVIDSEICTVIHCPKGGLRAGERATSAGDAKADWREAEIGGMGLGAILLRRPHWGEWGRVPKSRQQYTDKLRECDSDKGAGGEGVKKSGNFADVI